MSWTRPQVLLLIEEYRKCPCLYMIKHIYYKNKQARNDALEKIRHTLLHIRPETTTYDITKKIGTIRTTFSAEYKKVQKLNIGRSGADLIYKPNLYYYKALQFLKKCGMEPRPSQDALQLYTPDSQASRAEISPTPSVENYTFVDVDCDVNLQSPDAGSTTNASTSSWSPCSSVTGSNKRKRQNHSDNGDNGLLMEVITPTTGVKDMSASIKPVQQIHNEECEYIESFTKHLSKKLAVIKSKRSLERVMLKIAADVSDVIINEMDEENSN